jgi:glutamate/tyrosine decarboxylase-like PLP-dependent enzyme
MSTPTANTDKALFLEAPLREQLWRRVAERIEEHIVQTANRPVTPQADPAGSRALLRQFDFAAPMDPLAAVEFAADGLRDFTVHTTHPRYFGLFNPAVTTMGIAADALVAAFNPQLAVWAHSPFAVEVEMHLLRAFAEKFGWQAAHTDGTFTYSGSEANHTALLAALVHTFPDFAERGLRALPGAPVLYTSSEGHHSMLKAARVCGLGAEAVRVVPADERLRMDVPALGAQIARDRRDGCLPFLVAGTAGTTNAGALDPLEEIAAVAARERLWFHADAAWGGAAALVPELRPLLAGIERADSITFDAHKWLSVPMSAGMFLTRHTAILARTFHVSAAYVPRDGDGGERMNPLAHSLQWSRRFTGLKLFLSLAVAGWEGYAAAVRRMTEMGERLREALRDSGWRVVNQTPLPVVCFDDARRPDAGAEYLEREYLERVMRAVVDTGRAWLSTTRLGPGVPVLRACITNFRTAPDDLAALVEALEQARRAAGE